MLLVTYFSSLYAIAHMCVLIICKIKAGVGSVGIGTGTCMKTENVILHIK